MSNVVKRNIGSCNCRTCTQSKERLYHIISYHVMIWTRNYVQIKKERLWIWNSVIEMTLTWVRIKKVGCLQDHTCVATCLQVGFNLIGVLKKFSMPKPAIDLFSCTVRSSPTHLLDGIWILILWSFWAHMSLNMLLFQENYISCQQGNSDYFHCPVLFTSVLPQNYFVKLELQITLYN